MRTGIRFTTWGNVGMADDVGNRIAPLNGGNEGSQTLVLGGLERQRIAALQLDAYGKVIATFALAPPRRTGVPGAPLAGHELHHGAIAPDEKMG